MVASHIVIDHDTRTDPEGFLPSSGDAETGLRSSAGLGGLGFAGSNALNYGLVYCFLFFLSSIIQFNVERLVFSI